MTLANKGASLFTVPFYPGEYRESTGDEALDLDHLLGEVWSFSKRGEYMLVKTHSSAFAWSKKVAKWSDDQNFVITPATAATDRIAGVGDNDIPDATSVPAAAYILIHRAGQCEVIHGDDTGNYVQDGQYVTADNDADTGKVVDGGTTYTKGVTFARAQETATAVDQVLTVQLEDLAAPAA